LWFVAPDRITFAAFSHFLSGAAKSERFGDEAEAFVQRFIAKETPTVDGA